MADADDYSRAQNAVDQAWLQRDGWLRSAVLNTARCGFFSSDRAISEYAERIWNLSAQPIGAPES
jgi:starch phosphorylase